MLQKFKITSCAFISCLFGLTLITVSPVFAEDSAAFVECQNIKQSLIGKDFGLMKEKKDCFKRLARELQADADKARELEEEVKGYRGELTTFQTDPQTQADGVKEMCGYLSNRNCNTHAPCDQLQQLCQGKEVKPKRTWVCSKQYKKRCGW